MQNDDMEPNGINKLDDMKQKVEFIRTKVLDTCDFAMLSDEQL